jgi:hypothetical protein
LRHFTEIDRIWGGNREISVISFGSKRALQIYFWYNECVSSAPLKSGSVNFFGQDRLMLFLNMINFRKNENCPSSYNLLAFQNGDFMNKGGDAIRTHLGTCEFCAAEVEFYAHYPQAEEKVEAAEIPVPLFELAEALLRNKHKDFSMLDRLLGENEGLTLEKV